MASFTEIPHDDKVQMLVDFCHCKLPIFTRQWDAIELPEFVLIFEDENFWTLGGFVTPNPHITI